MMLEQTETLVVAIISHSGDQSQFVQNEMQRLCCDGWCFWPSGLRLILLETLRLVSFALSLGATNRSGRH
jgi:hypothetical protein